MTPSDRSWIGTGLVIYFYGRLPPGPSPALSAQPALLAPVSGNRLPSLAVQPIRTKVVPMSKYVVVEAFHRPRGRPRHTEGLYMKSRADEGAGDPSDAMAARRRPPSPSGRSSSFDCALGRRPAGRPRGAGRSRGQALMVTRVNALRPAQPVADRRHLEPDPWPADTARPDSSRRGHHEAVSRPMVVEPIRNSR